MRWLEVCLGPSTTGENVAYIPALGPTLAWSLFSSPIPPERRCHRSCLKHKQLATVRVACSYRFDTFSPGCLQSAETQASSKLACKAVYLCLQCVVCVCVCMSVEKQWSVMWIGEKTDNKHWGPCFSQTTSSVQFSYSLSPYSSLSISFFSEKSCFSFRPLWYTSASGRGSDFLVSSLWIFHSAIFTSFYSF